MAGEYTLPTLKLKLEEEYSHLKLWFVCNVSWELDSFYCFLLILLVSILFSASNRFLLLQIVEVYNEEKQMEYSLRQW